MSTILNILLVEDDKSECEAISNYIIHIGDINLVRITNNSVEAIECVKEYSIDAIILDLELHIGSGNGIKFLIDLNELGLPKRPYILVTTNNISRLTHEQVRQLGADFIMTKCQKDYSAGNVIDFLISIKGLLQSGTQSIGMPIKKSTTVPAEDMLKKIEKYINREFDLVCISPKLLGRKYLREAIEIVTAGSTDYCVKIASKYKKSDESIIRAMQNAINVAWRTADIDDLFNHYTAHIHSTKGTPTVTEFIFYYAEKIKNEF
jgi:two-component system response regulator (stage 0 sporulation protein A)